MTGRPVPKPEGYLIHVWIRQITPMIWRRLLVRSDSTLADLHYTLQIAFAWTDYHLHRFRIHGKEFGIPRIEAVALASPEPVTAPHLARALRADELQVQLAIDGLNADYARPEHGLFRRSVRGGCRIAAKPALPQGLARAAARSVRPPAPLSLAALRTLADKRAVSRSRDSCCPPRGSPGRRLARRRTQAHRPRRPQERRTRPPPQNHPPVPDRLWAQEPEGTPHPGGICRAAGTLRTEPLVAHRRPPQADAPSPPSVAERSAAFSNNACTGCMNPTRSH